MHEIHDSDTDDSRYSDTYLRFCNKFSDCDVARMESYCTIGFDIEIINGYAWGEELFHSSCTLVTPSMMMHRFPIPLIDDTTKLCVHFDCCPSQLSHWIVLFHERALLPEKAFDVPFGFEEIVRLVPVNTAAGRGSASG